MPDSDWMKLAIAEAGKGISQGQTPFGAVIVRDGNLLAAAHNLVWQSVDITAHAEIVALRRACQTLASIDLSGGVIYSTCEPCPMCFAACHWAKLARIVFGAAITDAAAAGFHELTIPNSEMKSRGGSPIEIVPGFLREECAQLFRTWSANPNARHY
ncbi:MAG TPA: nucleoside deaminase [Tepidisphaeraceae bacterium]|jgi:tRNA(Arg) A34 adenosine deaminase TadA